MREMKPSSMEWVGDIPASWKVMPNKYLMHKKKKSALYTMAKISFP